MFVLIPCAGLGTRLQGADSSATKVLCDSGSGQTILECSLRAIVSSAVAHTLIIICRSEDEPLLRKVAAAAAPSLKVLFVPGGATRQESIRNGLLVIPDRTELVLIHDGARPLATPELFRQVAEAARMHRAAIAAVPMKSSVKESVDGIVVTKSCPRRYLWEVQTPQCFAVADLMTAHEQALRDGVEATDDSELVERLGIPVTIVSGDDCNLKITTPVDLLLLRGIIQDRGFGKKYAHLRSCSDKIE